MGTINVKDANGAIVSVAKVSTTGEATAAIDAMPVVQPVDAEAYRVLDANTAAAIGALAAAIASLPHDQALTLGQLQALTIAISAQAMPLPPDASTASAQAVANALLSAIDGKLPFLASGRVPVTDPTALPLPAGAATAAAQATGNTSMAAVSTSIGGPADAPAANDSGSWSLLALLKRGLTQAATMLSRMPDLVSGRIPVDGSGAVQLGAGAVTATTQRVTLSSDGAGVTELQAIRDRLPAALSGGRLSVTPALSAAGVASKATSAVSGSSYVPFAAQAATMAYLSNQTGFTIELQIGGTGDGFEIPSGQVMPIPGITNLSQLGIRRKDAVATAVTVTVLWSS